MRICTTFRPAKLHVLRVPLRLRAYQAVTDLGARVNPVARTELNSQMGGCTTNANLTCRANLKSKGATFESISAVRHPMISSI